MNWSTDRLRKAYLEYFEEKGHVVKSGAGLVPTDPSMLFTSAGMVQFKDIFWGRKEPDETRLVTCQKCFRAVDIERVGRTWYHNTFFEMLGNFSFGDYFKRGAIELAWEFVTDVLGLKPEKLWVSVYETDDEAYAIWEEEIGVPEEKIQRLGKEENWWGPVGDSGPCGPDSEIFYDAGESYSCGPNCQGLACDCNRFNEVWNLVFTGYEMDEEGNVYPLERQNIDTGMGLERTAAVLQGVESVFETDVFRPIVSATLDTLAVEEPDGEVESKVYRIADHVRAAAFLISEGVIPSNEGRGYVLRRVIRRAVRSGDSLGRAKPFLLQLLPAVIETMGSTYPELKERRDLVENVIGTEEEAYLDTLEEGRDLFYDLAKSLKKGETELIPGEEVFRLYDTHGVPPDLIEELAGEEGLAIDREGFEREMEKQRQRARASTNLEEDDGVQLQVKKTEFVGYEKDQSRSEVLSLLREGGEIDKLEEGEEGEAVLDVTPFYAQAGGQVSDQGFIDCEGGRARVREVRERDGVYFHRLEVIQGGLIAGKECVAQIDEGARRATERNHTATHLLHKALGEVLGPHVVQSGSKVGPEEFRFDFNHFELPSREEIERVEDLVNQVVWEDRSVNIDWVSDIEEAKGKGATAHFEEEYRGKEKLRIVSVEDFSKELCGGTHVDRTGEIGGLAVVSVESVASGIRRIRAVTGRGLIEDLREKKERLRKLARMAGAGESGLLQRFESILEEKDELERRVERLTERLLGSLKEGLLEEAKGIDVPGQKEEFQLIVGLPELEVEPLKRLADSLVAEMDLGAVLLGSRGEDSASLICKLAEGDSRASRELRAGDVISKTARIIGGGGGGGKEFAQGGGPEGEMLEEALREGERFIRETLTEEE